MEIFEKIVELSKWIDNDYLKKIHDIAKNQIIIYDFNKRYWLNIPDDKILLWQNYLKLWEYDSISEYWDANSDKDKWYGRYIAWEDDGKQPLNEWLYNISFPIWAYIFWDLYLDELFKDFRDELKSYNYKYIDTVNSNIYFSLDECSQVRNDLNSILNKYKSMASDKEKEIRKKQLEKELESLK
jgi:hypothetical protein